MTSRGRFRPKTVETQNFRSQDMTNTATFPKKENVQTIQRGTTGRPQTTNSGSTRYVTTVPVSGLTRRVQHPKGSFYSAQDTTDIRHTSTVLTYVKVQNLSGPLSLSDFDKDDKRKQVKAWDLKLPTEAETKDQPLIPNFQSINAWTESSTPYVYMTEPWRASTQESDQDKSFFSDSQSGIELQERPTKNPNLKVYPNIPMLTPSSISKTQTSSKLHPQFQTGTRKIFLSLLNPAKTEIFSDETTPQSSFQARSISTLVPAHPSVLLLPDPSVVHLTNTPGPQKNTLPDPQTPLRENSSPSQNFVQENLSDLQETLIFQTTMMESKSKSQTESSQGDALEWTTGATQTFNHPQLTSGYDLFATNRLEVRKDEHEDRMQFISEPYASSLTTSLNPSKNSKVVSLRPTFRSTLKYQPKTFPALSALASPSSISVPAQTIPVQSPPTYPKPLNNSSNHLLTTTLFPLGSKFNPHSSTHMPSTNFYLDTSSAPSTTSSVPAARTDSSPSPVLARTPFQMTSSSFSVSSLISSSRLPTPQLEPSPAPLRSIYNPLPPSSSPVPTRKQIYQHLLILKHPRPLNPVLKLTSTTPKTSVHQNHDPHPNLETTFRLNHDHELKPIHVNTDTKQKQPSKPPGPPTKEGKYPEMIPRHSSWELGMLLGCSAGLGMVLVVGVRYMYRQACGKRTGVTLNDREREYERGERGLIHVQECGDLVRVRRIRDNSFVLLAEYDILAAPGD